MKMKLSVSTLSPLKFGRKQSVKKMQIFIEKMEVEIIPHIYFDEIPDEVIGILVIATPTTPAGESI